MSLVDVDVISIAAPKDRTLRAFHDELKRQAGLAKAFEVADEKKLVDDVTDVLDMVERITSTIGGRRIRRLRIFGHGSDNAVLIGHLLPTHRAPDWWNKRPKFEQSDLGKVIGGKPAKWEQDGQIVKEGYVFFNEPNLAKLSGRFDPGGWVELHSCRIAGETGKELIKALAKLWQVEVRASEGKQFVGGGLEGKVWVAKPWGTLSPAVPKAA
jgi:hypothetical protein